MLKGRSALITGSLDGIGFAIASALAAKGCNVMLNGFGDEAMIGERLKSLRAFGRLRTSRAIRSAPSSGR